MDNVDTKLINIESYLDALIIKVRAHNREVYARITVISAGLLLLSLGLAGISIKFLG